MSLSELQSKIEQRTAIVGVIGLGYVGLPVACAFASAGFQVIGVDVKAERVALINQGCNPIDGAEPGLTELLAKSVDARRLCATINYSDLAQADVILIDVETPVDETHSPQYIALAHACQNLAQVIRKDTLVIVESTIAPGTMKDVVRPLLEGSGKKVNIDFFLGACPERVMPGKLLANLHSMSRVCGAYSSETSAAMIALYRHIVAADLDAADCITAELVKTAENAYRDVNIAFANELALICEVTGGDFLRVRELVNKSPGRNVLFAGAGVGGHCIPKDPWLLASSARDKIAVRLIPAARAVNDSMPLHIANLTRRALELSGVDIAASRIVVMGYAYLEDSDDSRNSPTAALVAQLKAWKASVIIHDPWVTEYKSELMRCLENSDAIVVMVAHRDYKTVDLAVLREHLRTPILIDGRRVFDAQLARSAGFSYFGVGQGKVAEG